MLKYNWSSN